MKIIVFEGIDKVGKTTTIKGLSRQLENAGYRPIILAKTFQECYDYKGDTRIWKAKLQSSFAVLQSLTWLGDNYIVLVDRLQLSEIVYGKILRNGDYDPMLCAEIDNWLTKQGAILVHIIPDCIKDIYENHKDIYGKIDGFTLEQYDQSFRLFCSLVITSTIPNRLEPFQSGVSSLLKKLKEGKMI